MCDAQLLQSPEVTKDLRVDVVIVAHHATSLARTIHEGTDLHGHACKFGNVGVGCRSTAVILPAVDALPIDCRAWPALSA